MSVALCPPAVEEQLERDEVVFHATAQFPLPQGDDHAFLLRQTLRGPGHKYICHNPHTGCTTGFARTSDDQAEQLGRILSAFSREVTAWVAKVLPRYQGGIEPDRVSYRPDEEATRSVRLNARNDLLHIDAFPNRPAQGRRILRVFANINPAEPRVWATSEPLPRLLDRYGPEAAKYRAGWLADLGENVFDLFRPRHIRPAASDRLMRRLHDYLKANHDFQQRTPRRLWHFPAGSVWLVMTDGCSYADLRGRYALEHSFFIAPGVLVRPELAPEELLRRAS